MKCLTINSLFIVIVAICTPIKGNGGVEEAKAKKWLKNYNETAVNELFKSVIAQWNYNVNITDDNLLRQSEADAHLTIFQQKAAEEASKFNTSLIKDPKVVRELLKVKTIGIVLNETDALALSSLMGNMTAVYSTASICSINFTTLKQNCSIQWSLQPDLIDILAKNRDYDVLSYVWKSWRDQSGRPIKQRYFDFVQLSNKGAKAGGFVDTGAWWRWPYEDELFEKNVEKLYYQLLPLYEQLHAYVRRRLMNKYKGKFSTSAIPAHILGNMWAQDWSNLNDFIIPYPNKSAINVTDTMIKKNFTVQKMFHMSDEFFQSIGMIPMPGTFWNRTMYEKPSDRQVVCHASAWDFFVYKDVRVKMCTKVNVDDFITVHHEMGHIQYYLQYADKPVAFRDGGNPGFHEAIGDTIALAVKTPAHLKSVGLLPDYVEDEEQDINNLFQMAMGKIAFLPFGYLVDLWRWNVFNGEFDYDSWNHHWVDLRYRYQGVTPPVSRSGTDFDAGSKFHIPANSAYMSYFVAFIVQFQFYKSMCNASGHVGPLHKCDFYKSEKAGALLSNLMTKGSSEPWTDTMKEMTGRPEMSADAVLEYFKPLSDWLKKNNFGECYGWGEQWPDHVTQTLSKPRCSKSFS